MTSQLFDAYGRTHTLPGLYEEFRQTFTLTHTDRAGVTTVLAIREPGGWSGKVKFTLERDMDWHGVKSEYTDAQTPLTFDSYSGRDFVESILRAEGDDTNITFQQGVTVGNTFLIEYEGRLLISSYKRDKRKIVVGLERLSIEQAVKARWETKVNLFNYISLDNQIVRPAIPITVPLIPQGLSERFQSYVTATKLASQTFGGDTNGHVWITFDTSKPDISEIEEVISGKPLGLAEAEGPIAYDEYLFKFRSSGVRRVQIDLSYRLWAGIKKRTLQIGKSFMTGYTLETSIVLKHTDGTLTVYPIAPTQKLGKAAGDKNYRQLAVSTTVSGTLDVKIDTRAGDKLFWFAKWAMTHDSRELGSTTVEITAYRQKIRVTGRSSNVATPVRALPVFEAIRTAIGLTTNHSDRLRSSYYGLLGDRYGVDGCGAQKVLTNGFQIRQFSVESHPPTLSLRETLLSLQAIDAIGLTFTTEIQPDDSVVDVMEIRPAVEFYNPVELMRIESVGDYSEEVIKEWLYSTIEFGYEKAVEDGVGALDECFTKQQAATPIKNTSEKASYVSTLIASSLAIETTRREQFATSPKDSTSFDDAGFIIQCRRDAGFIGPATIATGFAGNIITVASSIPSLSIGAKISLSGSQSNNGLFTVTFVSDAAKTPWSFYVAEGVLIENVPALSIQSAQLGGIDPTAPVNLIPETGSDLALATGFGIYDRGDGPGQLTDDGSGQDTYNLRLTPGRNFRRQTPFWAGCLIGQPDTALVRKTNLPKNSNVVTRMNPDGCDSGQTVVEKASIGCDELLLSALIEPRRIRCSTRLSHDQIQRLRIGHFGLLPPEMDANGDLQDVNYGRITVPDEAGEWVTGWLEKLEWLPGSEKAVLSIIRSAVDLVNTPGGLNCSQFIGITVNQAETLDEATRRRLELCRWLDVDIL